MLSPAVVANAAANFSVVRLGQLWSLICSRRLYCRNPSPPTQGFPARFLGIESLNVAGMIKAGLQSKALADAGMSGLLNQIRYKAQWSGQLHYKFRLRSSGAIRNPESTIESDFGRPRILSDTGFPLSRERQEQ